MKKLIVLVLIIGAAGGGYYWWSSRTVPETKKEVAAPETVKATRGALRATVEATGRVVPEQEIEIKCKASGEIIKLPVDVSDQVKKGDLLVQLDPEDEDRNVKRADVNLAVSESRRAQAKLALKIGERELISERLRAAAELQSAEAKEDDTSSRLERVQQLREKKIASDEELDAARAAQAQAEATLKNAQARVEDVKTKEVQLASRQHDINIAEQQVEADRLALDDAKRRLEDTTVTAPIDGVVATRNVQVGQIIASGVSNVGGGTSVLTLADLQRIYVLVSVDESDIGRVTVGQEATVTVDAYPESMMNGTVQRVATKGVVTSNVVTFEVKVEVTSRRKNLLKPEMTANVSITTVDKPDALLLPVEVVNRRGPKTFVLLSGEGGKPTEQEVKIGDSDGENIEIIEGLQAEDEVFYPDSKGADSWSNDREAARNQRRNERMQRRVIRGG